MAKFAMPPTNSEELRELVKQSYMEDPRLKARLEIGEKFREELAITINDKLKAGATFGSLSFALLSNTVLLAYINEGMNRGRARDKIGVLIDGAFDLAEAQMQGASLDLKAKSRQLDESFDEKVTLRDIAESEEFKALARLNHPRPEDVE